MCFRNIFFSDTVSCDIEKVYPKQINSFTSFTKTRNKNYCLEINRRYPAMSEPDNGPAPRHIS